MPHRTVVLPAKLLPTPESTSPFNDRRAGEPMGEVDSGIQQIEPAGALWLLMELKTGVRAGDLSRVPR